jgi:hypothetical protein
MTRLQEQKLSDIAGCLADVLKCTAGDTSPTFYEGKQYLNILLQQLSSIRGKESRYLKPLMAKMEGLMSYDMTLTLPPPSAPPSTTSMEQQPLPPITNAYLTTGNGGLSVGNSGRGLSVSQGSVEMLRSMSMSGSLGMPVLQAEMWERRPSGRIGSEEEMVTWLLSGPVQ